VAGGVFSITTVGSGSTTIIGSRGQFAYGEVVWLK
jgi:hypothetical protein